MDRGIERDGDHPLARALRSAAARIALQAVADIEDLLGHGLGLSKVRGMLRGSRSAGVRQEGLEHLPLYGSLGFASSRWLDGLLEQLFALGHVERIGALRPIVRLTARGEQALFDGGPIPPAEPDRPPADQQPGLMEQSSESLRVGSVPQSMGGSGADP